MFRFSVAACICLALTGAALAQPQKLPPDLAGLPDEIKTLQWKSIDISKVSALERCRALLLMNHVLDELSANSTAEADLMSTYIDAQNLGSQFASTPPPPDPNQLAYPDAQKVAVALLRGPMSGSYYSTELADVSASGLVSYEQMYGRTCQRKWGEFEESRHLVRCMTSFLGNSQKLQDYDGWATAEAARREAAFQQRNPAPARAPQQQNAPAPSGQVQQLQQQLQQVQGALGAAEYQQQALAQQTAQAQQQAAVAQQQAAQAQQQTAQSQQPYYPAGYAVPVYGGYGGYGYGAYGTAGAAAAGAYAGATAANSNVSPAGAAAAGAAAANASGHNVSPAGAAAAGQYHGANSSWSHDASYNSAARSQTEQRMSSFHGASGAHGGGGRR